ncbi:hypothetical protein PoB_007486200 [Plakobranchus ocellatus]|uniref:Uncharacterized protein n=1 Tax=Plakobranchus ocellatus TaxID=259542 RepID=A0AAV4DVK8_9GAST|nr:hypothetical protein PoB_007486200 [Plakobranchus ocellatus]
MISSFQALRQARAPIAGIEPATRRVPADLKTDSLSPVPPTPRILMQITFSFFFFKSFKFSKMHLCHRETISSRIQSQLASLNEEAEYFKDILLADIADIVLNKAGGRSTQHAISYISFRSNSYRLIDTQPNPGQVRSFFDIDDSNTVTNIRYLCFLIYFLIISLALHKNWFECGQDLYPTSDENKYRLLDIVATCVLPGCGYCTNRSNKLRPQGTAPRDTPTIDVRTLYQQRNGCGHMDNVPTGATSLDLRVQHQELHQPLMFAHSSNSVTAVGIWIMCQPVPQA